MSKPASQNKVRPLFGRLAVHNGMITMAQLAEATGEQGRRNDGTNLGQIMQELGMIDDSQRRRLVLAQRDMVARQRAKQAAAQAAPGLEAEPARPAPPAARKARVATRPGAKAPASADPTSRSASPAETAKAASRPGATSEPRATRAAPPAAAASDDEPSLPAPVEAPPEPSAADRSAFEALLRAAVEQGASDVHIHSGARLQARVNGSLTYTENEPLDAQRAERLVVSTLSDEQRRDFYRRGELDLCYTLGGVGRFRTNVYRQQRGVDGVFRFIPPNPPSLEELGLPTSLAKHTNYHQGMVLVTGPAGCGKSTTLASLVDLINEERKEHILTIEDPIEFLHPSKRCLVNQRSVHSHTESFARALRAALREDPDVIVIGELRDLETISLALSAAETGHLVLATLHTNNSIRTLNRMIGAFPADQQDQIRTMISESLRAVISQRLISRADGAGRVAAIEMLVVTRAVANLIRENKTFQIHSVLQTGAAQGMALLDHSIKELLQSGVITKEEALRHCDEPKTLGGA